MDRRFPNRRGVLSLGAAAGLHLTLLAGLLQVAPVARRAFVTPAVPVILVPRPRVEPPPKPRPKPQPPKPDKAPAAKSAEPKPASPPPPPQAAAPPPRPHLVAAADARPSPAPAKVVAPAPGLSDSEIAGAVTAGSGEGDGAGSGAGGQGRGCDMVRRLQNALRGDRRIQAAVSHAQVPGGRPLIVWRGDWIQSSGEAGKGLAGVRQAIAMEVAFAPEACRAEPVRGVVLLSLADGGRIALGSGVWRWSDLLFAAGAAPRRRAFN